MQHWFWHEISTIFFKGVNLPAIRPSIIKTYIDEYYLRNESDKCFNASANIQETIEQTYLHRILFVSHKLQRKEKNTHILSH